MSSNLLEKVAVECSDMIQEPPLNCLIQTAGLSAPFRFVHYAANAWTESLAIYWSGMIDLVKFSATPKNTGISSLHRT